MSWGKEYREGNTDVANALLALAEQQRIANLIALAAIEPAMKTLIITHHMGKSPVDGGSYSRGFTFASRDIRDALKTPLGHASVAPKEDKP